MHSTLMKPLKKLLVPLVFFCKIRHSVSLAAGKSSVSDARFKYSMQPSMANVDMQSTTDGSTTDIRGNRYGVENNSTILSPEDAAARVGVLPTLEAPKQRWQRAWKLQKAVLPALHAFDSCRPPNSSLSLACLWWKALAGNDSNSPVFDNFLSYDLLPRGTRFLVGKRLRRFYPRLHHANVEIRTAYLDQAVAREISSIDPSRKIRLVSIGAGYDVRSLKFVEKKLIDQAVELDLPEVVEAKERLLKKRLLRRRPWLKDEPFPIFRPVDLNKVDDVEKILDSIIEADQQGSEEKWHTIFTFEGVMIYLDEGVPRKLLQICRKSLRQTEHGHLCFADRLENIPGGDEEIGKAELASTGWELVDWLPKPGLARHMGSARPIRPHE